MESNGLNEQGKWGQTHRWRADDSWWGVGGIEQKGIRTPEHGQQWITVGGCWAEQSIRGLNGNGKNTIKIKKSKKKINFLKY